MPLSLAPLVSGTPCLQRQGDMLPILHQDGRLVCIDKPAGLLVHPTGLDAGETRFAMHLLRNQIRQHVWPVHRLDKGTSGVLLFALDADTARELNATFDSGHVHKTYQAIVRGWPLDAGSIDHPLRREDEDGRRTEQRVLVQEALTHYKTLERFTLPIEDLRPNGQFFHQTRFALVELHPVTGRRHQLRRHMKHIGHPIVGDTTHGKGPLNRAVAQCIGQSRLWLHATELDLPWLGQPLCIRSPIHLTCLKPA
jgi:tRNA pseudouridine65 synthase